eukprot:gene2324-8616_t
MEWASIKEELAASTKQRLIGVDALAVFCANKSLDIDQTLELVDLVPSLLQDANFKVAHQTLQILSVIINKGEEGIKPYTSSILPPVVERLADTRQPVRQEACEVLLNMLKAMRPDYVLQKMARYWSHRHWKAIARGIPNLFASKDQNSYLITQVVNLVEDPNEIVRAAAIDCLREIYRVLGEPLVDNLKSQSIRPAAMRELILRLDEVAPTHLALPDVAPSGVARKVTKEAAPSPPLSPSSETDTTAHLDINEPTSLAKRASATRKVAESSPVGAEPVVPIPISSERELVWEFEAAAAVLGSLAPDWQVRTAAMTRVEGLVAGNPGMLDAIADALKVLKIPLAVQLEDRRSCVSKTACQCLSSMAGIMGLRFQELMLHVLPVLFKIMAECSAECVRLLLERCQAPRAVLVLVQAATKDRNPKIKHSCAKYLVQVMETWAPSSYVRYMEDLEGVMKVSAQAATAEVRSVAKGMNALYADKMPDMAATAEARSAAKGMFASYADKMPDMAQAFLRRQEPSLQERLCKGASGGSAARAASARIPIGPRKGLGDRPRIHRPTTSRPSSTIDGVLLFTPEESTKAGSGTLGEAPPQPTLQPSPQVANKAHAAEGSGEMSKGGESYSSIPMRGLSGRGAYPLAGSGTHSVDNTPAAANMFLASTQPARVLESFSQSPSLSLSASGPFMSTFPSDASPSLAPALAKHSPRATSTHSTVGRRDSSPITSGASALAKHSLRAALTLSTVGPGDSSPITSGGMHSPSSVPRTLSKLVSSLLTSSRAWNEKVDLLKELTALLQAASDGHGGLSTTDMERLAPKFVDLLEDVQPRVCTAALECFMAAASACPSSFDLCLDRVLPVLCQRTSDQKESIKSMASSALSVCATCFGADLLLVGLVRSMEACKTPKSRVAVLDFGASQLGRGRPAGVPKNQNQLRQWLTRVVPLMNDKNAEVKRKAVEAVETVYCNIDEDAVLLYAAHASGTEMLSMKKLIGRVHEQAAANAAGTGPGPRLGLPLLPSFSEPSTSANCTGAVPLPPGPTDAGNCAIANRALVTSSSALSHGGAVVAGGGLPPTYCESTNGALGTGSTAQTNGAAVAGRSTATTTAAGTDSTAVRSFPPHDGSAPSCSLAPSNAAGTTGALAQSHAASCIETNHTNGSGIPLPQRLSQSLSQPQPQRLSFSTGARSEKRSSFSGGGLVPGPSGRIIEFPAVDMAKQPVQQHPFVSPCSSSRIPHVNLPPWDPSSPLPFRHSSECDPSPSLPSRHSSECDPSSSIPSFRNSSGHVVIPPSVDSSLPSSLPRPPRWSALGSTEGGPVQPRGPRPPGWSASGSTEGGPAHLISRHPPLPTQPQPSASPALPPYAVLPHPAHPYAASAPTLDSAAASKMVSLLAHRLQASEACETTLSSLLVASRAGYATVVWEPSVPILVHAASSTLRSITAGPTPAGATLPELETLATVRESSATLMGEMAQHHPSTLLSSAATQGGGCVLDELVPALLAACCDDTKEVVTACKLALDLIVGCPLLLPRAMELLTSRLPTPALDNGGPTGTVSCWLRLAVS